MIKAIWTRMCIYSKMLHVQSPLPLALILLKKLYQSKYFDKTFFLCEFLLNLLSLHESIFDKGIVINYGL